LSTFHHTETSTSLELGCCGGGGGGGCGGGGDENPNSGNRIRKVRTCDDEEEQQGGNKRVFRKSGNIFGIGSEIGERKNATCN
jgi:hypothetical protein